METAATHTVDDAGALPSPPSGGGLAAGIAPVRPELNDGVPAVQHRVLVVDDSKVNRKVLASLIAQLGHTTIEAGDGLEALRMAAAELPDLILLDILMPGMDGRQVLSALKGAENTKRIPVVMVTGLEAMESVITCIKLGADDYFAKPFDRTLLKARVDALLERKRLQDRERELRRQVELYNTKLEELVADQVQQIAAGHVSTIFAMSKLAESRDPETGQHLERMREFCRILAQHLRKHPAFSGYLNDRYIDALYAASPLHDIGKVGIPDHILLKAGKHTPEERQIMEQHTTIGADTLRKVYESHPHNELVHLGIQIAEAHHEWWDGSGYPHKRQGESIPLSARILTLADVYDALRAERVYKPAFSHDEARKLIVDAAGTHFDPAIVDGFLSAEEEFVAVRQRWGHDHL
jgi:putative two-component system response regulator